MHLITEQTLCDSFKERWKTQYGKHKPDWKFANGNKNSDVMALVDALPEHPTAIQIQDIVGNDSWTDIGACHVCGGYPSALVELGEPPEYESHTARICGRCLQVALDLIDSAKVKPCTK